MKDRIKKLRKILDLTQQEFADKIGVTRNTVATYETGKSGLSASVISLICTTFNVNREWLETGNGEMFIELNRQQKIASLGASLFKEEEESFKSRLFFALDELDESEWELLEKIALKIVHKKD